MPGDRGKEWRSMCSPSSPDATWSANFRCRPEAPRRYLRCASPCPQHRRRTGYPPPGSGPSAQGTRPACTDNSDSTSCPLRRRAAWRVLRSSGKNRGRHRGRKSRSRRSRRRAFWQAAPRPSPLHSGASYGSRQERKSHAWSIRRARWAPRRRCRPAFQQCLRGPHSPRRSARTRPARAEAASRAYRGRTARSPDRSAAARPCSRSEDRLCAPLERCTRGSRGRRPSGWRGPQTRRSAHIPCG